MGTTSYSRKRSVHVNTTMLFSSITPQVQTMREAKRIQIWNMRWQHSESETWTR